jgi:hypothetical protein
LIFAMGKGGVPDVGLLDTSSENYWEWSLRIEDLLVYKELADCVQRDGAKFADVTHVSCRIARRCR